MLHYWVNFLTDCCCYVPSFFSLQSGFLITKIPKNSMRSPARRVLYCDESGYHINWRAVRESDYPSKAEFLADCGSRTSYSTTSMRKEAIPLSKLTSCQYSKDKYDEDQFFIRLVFEGVRNLDIKLMNKNDWEYCMDGFESISKNKDKFAKPPTQEAWKTDKYQPVVWEYAPGKTCNVGCGNSLEDIFIISSCYISLWSVLVGFFALLLKGAMDTDDKSTLLMMFFAFGIIFVALVALSVITGQIEVEENRKKKARQGLDEDDI